MASVECYEQFVKSYKIAVKLNWTRENLAEFLGLIPDSVRRKVGKIKTKMTNKKVCELCEETGVINKTPQFPNHPDDPCKTIEGEEPCLCQMEGELEYEMRVKRERCVEAGLAHAGKDEEGDDLWIGTYDEWNKLN